MKPMLASDAADPRDIRYPLLVSPKLDGVRCLIIDGVAMSRSLKPIPNAYVQVAFGRKALNGLDGELIVGSPTAPDAYRATMSAVMSEGGEPSATFHVFDDFTVAGPFSSRLAVAARRAEMLKTLTLVPHEDVRTVTELRDIETDYLAQGYEGVMLRDPTGPYKHGRSTAREGWLLKLKRFEDGEATVLDAAELRVNGNAPTRNALGYQERSSHKANLKPGGMLGALTVKDLKTGVVFDIGSGFTADDRIALWRDSKLIGKVVKYKHQPTGVKDKPRFPVYLGFRDGRDM